jgi:polyphenol oxidase
LSRWRAVFFRDENFIYRARPLLEFSWLEHGFGTRRSAAWRGDPALVTLRQIHSDRCVHADGRAGCLGEGDALVTASPGALLAVRTADCVPILLVDEAERAVAAVHAGWRGTAAEIAAKVVAAMRSRFGSRPERMHAAIGPGIGPCCYEVGPEVAVRFRRWLVEAPASAGGSHLDLAETNRQQLLAAGLPDTQLYIAGLCTKCEAGDFFSWRRDLQRTGSMLSAIRTLG